MSGVETTRVSSRGQVVIPQSIREDMGLEAGQLLAVYGGGDTVVLKRVDTPDVEEMEQLLEWGEAFAEEQDISREDVREAVADLRDESA
jgi:AbrB family looped-hinge helix DNA binding protein